MAEVILPGTYITVRDEGLITAGRVASGNIGLVGTAEKGPINQVQIIGTFSEAKEIFGEKGSWIDGVSNELTLIRALEQIYNNGGRTVYAVRTATDTAEAATFQLTDEEGDDLYILSADSPGTWGNTISIQITNDETATGDVKKIVEIISNNLQEVFVVNNPSELAKAVNKGSRLVSAPTTAETSFESSILDNVAKTNFQQGSNGADATAIEYQTSLTKLESDIVNIVVLAGQVVTPEDASAATVLQGHLDGTSGNNRERIGIIGCNGSTQVQDIVAAKQNVSSDRLVFVAPGIKSLEGNTLSGAYAAAAVAGLVSSLPVQASPTNKVVNIPGLAEEYTFSKLEKLVQENILVLEKKSGFRVVKGITTSENSAWHQITTRRIVDYAKYGIRSACNPYIGKLNNERVRGAMKSTIDAFLTRMVEDEALVSYELEVSATRAQEIAGEAIVTMTIRPTFSIDFIKVTMYLG